MGNNKLKKQRMKSFFAIAAAVGLIEPKTRAVFLGDEDELVNGLRELIRVENEIEREKVSLALKPDFNLTDAFKIFDVNYVGNISATELREGLAAIGVFPTSEELQLFLTRYDTTGD